MSSAISDPARLSGADVGSIRVILAGIANSRGFPGSPEHTELRNKQIVGLPEPWPTSGAAGYENYLNAGYALADQIEEEIKAEMDKPQEVGPKANRKGKHTDDDDDGTAGLYL